MLITIALVPILGLAFFGSLLLYVAHRRAAALERIAANLDREVQTVLRKERENEEKLIQDIAAATDNGFLPSARHALQVVWLPVELDVHLARNRCAYCAARDLPAFVGAVEALWNSSTARRITGVRHFAYARTHHDLAGRTTELARLLMTLITPGIPR
jgi:hypothetical protein